MNRRECGPVRRSASRPRNARSRQVPSPPGQGGIASCQLGCMCTVPSLPEDERHTTGFAWLDVQHELQGAARVETRTSASRELIAEQRGRRAQGPVAPDELGSITGVRSWCRRRSPERDAVAEFRVVGVARHQDARHVVHLRDDETALAGARRSEAPLDVSEYADAPRDGRGVCQCQHCQLHRILTGYEDRQFLLDAGHGMLIACDPAPCRMTQRPASARRGSGPGVAPHTAPESSSLGRRLRPSDRSTDRWRTGSIGSRGCFQPR